MHALTPLELGRYSASPELERYSVSVVCVPIGFTVLFILFAHCLLLVGL